jgi:hypothetical protein
VFARRLETPPDGVNEGRKRKGGPEAAFACAGEDLNLHGLAATSPSS